MFKKENIPSKKIRTYKCAAIKTAFCFPINHSKIQILKKLKNGKKVRTNNIPEPNKVYLD